MTDHDDEWLKGDGEWPPCPVCGRTAVPIVYGYPDEEVMEAARRGEVALGGCVIVDDQPTHQCVAGHQWPDQLPG